MLHLRHGDRLIKAVKVDKGRKVRAIKVKHIRNAQRAERVGQFKVGADVELWHAPDEFAARQAHAHVVTEQSAHGAAVRKKAFKARALVGQQEAHRLPTLKAQLRHGVVFAPAVSGTILREVHEVDRLLRAVCCGEGILLCRILPEFVAPLVLKVERRQKQHHRLGLRLDLARRVLQEIARVLIDPFADGLVRLLISHRGGERRSKVLLGEHLQRLFIIGDVLIQPHGAAEQRLSRRGLAVEIAPDIVARSARRIGIFKA